MEPSAFERHLTDPVGRGPAPAGAAVGSSGGAPCGDLIRIALLAGDGRIEQASFDAEGCGAMLAAGSACMSLVLGAPLLEAARVGSADVAAGLGGLSPGKHHAADLAADALHRALAGIWARSSQALLETEPERVLVGFSGGVDSAVAALLERRAGREVIAVTLKLWADPVADGSRSCCSPEAVLQARFLAHHMGLPHLTLDLQENFRELVVNDFVAEHDGGRTPNPCVRCNGMVRFDEMLALASRIGASTLVTGHYARVAHDAEGPLLVRASDSHKDQTYMLSGLRPQLLDRVRFPLADLSKPQVRSVAAEAGLPVAGKSESQDLCFLAGTTRERFLAQQGAAKDRPGEIVDRRGRVLGRHSDQRRFTVGQRRGLGLAAAEPQYVLDKDAASSRVVVGPHEQLAVQAVMVSPATLYRDGSRVDRVKLRYRSQPVPCSLARPAGAGAHAELELELHEQVHGAAAGQTACLLEGDSVLGYGTIAASRRRAAA